MSVRKCSNVVQIFEMIESLLTYTVVCAQCYLLT